MSLCLMDGNEAMARAAIFAGCRFFAGYPITPATSIFSSMLALLPPMGGICLQGEDEIASIGFCLGASMAGMKTMTATSGPGISLYSEQISFAVGSEIPIVIVDVQRLGPSTGSATKGADGDIQFLQWSNSGGLSGIVLAPADLEDCMVLTVHAFNLAEQFRCPVFLASNKEIAMTREALDLDRVRMPAVQERRLAPEGEPYVPFRTGAQNPIPDFLPIGANRLVRQTSSTHGPDGYITTDPEEIRVMEDRLLQKIESAVDRFTFFDELETPGADTLVIAYGVTSRAARVAVRAAAAAGSPASLLVLKTLWPVPERLIVEKAAPYRRIIVVEMNLGQYVREIRRLLPAKEIHFLGQMNGDLIKPHRIQEVLCHA